MNEKSSGGGPSPGTHNSHAANYLRRGSVCVSTETLKNQSVVPTAIPGETKRTTPLKNNGDGRKNLLNLMAKQVENNKNERKFQESVKMALTKDTIMKKERQDKIVDLFFKKEAPLLIRQNTPKPEIKKAPKTTAVAKPKGRGNLDYFLSQSNFKEPKCLSQEQKKKKNNKYDAIDTRLKTSPSATMPGNSLNLSKSSTSQPPPPNTNDTARLITKPRLPPNKKPVPVKAKPETALLPYPEDVNKSEGNLHFSDVWKKAEGKDIFPYVNRSVLSCDEMR